MRPGRHHRRIAAGRGWGPGRCFADGYKRQPGRPGRRGDKPACRPVATLGRLHSALDGSLCSRRSSPASIGLLWRTTNSGTIGGIGLLMLLGLQLSTSGRIPNDAHANRCGCGLSPDSSAEESAGAGAAKRGANQFLKRRQPRLRTPLHGIPGRHTAASPRTRDPVRAQDRTHRVLGHAPARADQRPDRRVAARGQLPASCGVLPTSRPSSGRWGRLPRYAAPTKGIRVQPGTACRQPCWVSGDPAGSARCCTTCSAMRSKFTEGFGQPCASNA